MRIAVLSNVTKIYERQGNGAAALKQVSFEALPGELVLLLGPSGSGKTTFLTLLAGFQKPSSGNVFLFGKDILEYSSSGLQHLRANHIGFIFQTFNLIESLTVKENVMLVTKFAGLGKGNANKRADDLLIKFGVGHLKTSYPNTLSQGEKQRVAVVRALVNEAELIIADEPTGSLSVSQGVQIVSFLKESVDKEQRTVIMVSHDERIKNFADRTFYLRDGVMELI
jgi:putative ABC transport system ATP-binding protein